MDNFSTKSYCLEILKNSFDITTYSYLNFESYRKIAFSIAVQGEDEHRIFIFQNVTPSFLYGKYKAIAWNRVHVPTGEDQPSLIEQDGVFVLKNTPDCYYVKDADKLYFKNLSSITTIFDGINELYRNATDEEVDTLLHWSELQVEGGFDKNKVKTANRRKIKEAIQRFDNFTEDQKRSLSRYIEMYCPALIDATTQKYKISSEEELTNFLNSVNQRYYTTEIDQTKRLANSVTDL